MKITPTPELWVTPEILTDFTREITPTKSGAHKKTGQLLAAVLDVTAAPTHNFVPVSWRVSDGLRAERTVPPAKVSKFGHHALIRLVDEEAAELAGLAPRYYKKLTTHEKERSIAAGVRMPEDEYSTAVVKEPLVAQVIGYDHGVEQAFGVEGLLDVLRHNRPINPNVHQTNNVGKTLTAQLFDMREDPSELLREMALPLDQIELLTTRGLE